MNKYLLILERDKDKNDSKCISEVKVYAKVYTDGRTAIITRDEVISLIEKPYPAYVQSETESSGLVPVIAYPVKGKKFIKTIANDDEEDNLDNLHEIDRNGDFLNFVDFEQWLGIMWELLDLNHHA